jgi:tight adherence protein C
MESIIEFIQALTGNTLSLRVIVILLAATSVGVFGLGLAYIFLSATDPRRRRLESTSATGGVESSGQFVTFNTISGVLSRYVVPSETLDESPIIKNLTLAGLHSPTAAQNFFAIRAILTVVLPVGFILATRYSADLSANLVFFGAAAAAAIGYIGPSFVLDRLVEGRQKKLRNGFPDALDLMVVCVESGLGLAQSIQRVSEELDVSHPELSQELALVNAEMRAGVENIVALQNLGDRTGLEDVRALVSTLVQTLRFGTSVADALRVYAEEFRDKRMQAAEERAAKMGIKMIFPLVFFMFPGFFLVAIGPAVLQLIKAFEYTSG